MHTPDAPDRAQRRPRSATRLIARPPASGALDFQSERGTAGDGL
jgi:hypothetical protein